MPRGIGLRRMAESEITMSTSCLRTGLLSVMLACGGFSIATAQDDDKSYLPPPSFRGTSETAGAKQPMQYSSAHSRNTRSASVQPRNRSIHVIQRRTYQRHRYVYYQPRPFFGFFD